jgi:hypothetical protein
MLQKLPTGLPKSLPRPPKSFRGEGGRPPPGLPHEYKPPSLLAQHKGLAVVFGILFLGLAVYFVWSLRAPRSSAPQKPPIYVEAVPQ